MPVLIILIILAVWAIEGIYNKCTSRQLPPELFEDREECDKFTMQMLRTPDKDRDKFLKETAKNWKKKDNK